MNNLPRPTIAKFFISSDEPRLRAGWRLLIHSLLSLLFIMIFAFFIALAILIIHGPEPFQRESNLWWLEILIGLPAITLATFISRRVLDRRTFTSLGFEINRHTLADLLAGFFISGLLIAIIFLLEWAFGWLKIEHFAWETVTTSNWLTGIFGGFILFIAVGFYEELLSRGYHLQNLIDGINLPWGLLFSSVVFAVLHMYNPSSSLSSTIGLFISGLFLAYGWIRTRQLWLSIGLHIGWNFFEGNIFGFPVSGLNTHQLVQHHVTGPKIFTGGTFGPEAGLILLPSLAIGVLIIWLYTRRR